MSKTRIELNDSMLDILVKMSEGNPGGATVLGRLMAEGAKIDPDDFMGGLGQVLWLDTLNIYGSRIWMLYKDVCHENLVNMIGILRAVQLGYMTQQQLNAAIDGDKPLTEEAFNGYLNEVRERLPDFAKA